MRFFCFTINSFMLGERRWRFGRRMTPRRWWRPFLNDWSDLVWANLVQRQRSQSSVGNDQLDLQPVARRDRRPSRWPTSTMAEVTGLLAFFVGKWTRGISTIDTIDKLIASRKREVFFLVLPFYATRSCKVTWIGSILNFSLSNLT